MQRLLVVCAVAWLLFVTFEAEPWRYDFPYGGWRTFLLVGVLPAAVGFGATWVWWGFRNDRKRVNK